MNKMTLDQSGTPIGHVSWDLKNIVIKSVAFPTTNITIKPGEGLALNL